MRIVILALALLTTTAHASHYPVGSDAETKMKTFDPAKYNPRGFSFVQYFLEQQELHDVGLHFDDMEIMLFDLPIPPDPQTQKAPH